MPRGEKASVQPASALPLGRHQALCTQGWSQDPSWLQRGDSVGILGTALPCRKVGVELISLPPQTERWLSSAGSGGVGEGLMLAGRAMLAVALPPASQNVPFLQGSWGGS